MKNKDERRQTNRVDKSNLFVHFNSTEKLHQQDTKLNNYNCNKMLLFAVEMMSLHIKLEEKLNLERPTIWKLCLRNAKMINKN